ncbi:MAG: hypothetical protein HY905_12885 [Deltaproteobacteria bacterium]|nr:hypothetical protein [Deltaproteobacteria bacterium]
MIKMLGAFVTVAALVPACGDDTSGDGATETIADSADGDLGLDAAGDAGVDADGDANVEDDTGPDADAGADADGDGDDDVDVPADAASDTDTDAAACPVCLDGSYDFGPTGGRRPYEESFSLAPCSSFTARREDWSGVLLAGCDADMAGCDPAAAAVTSAHVMQAVGDTGVQAAFALGSVLYGVDSRPWDGSVFRIARSGATTAEIFVGDPCGPGDPGCLPPPAGVLHLRDVLASLIAQLPTYPGPGCSTW